MTLSRTNPRAKPRWFALGGAVVLMLVLLATVVLAGHGLASLSGSNFEIDDNANLKLDHPALVDWGSLAHPNGPELRSNDAPTGQGDDSYKGGVKEDTECPGETTGSIPNNKSDLLTFHVYEEPGDPGFLNLAWSRVSDPSGTTLMDFEFNQSTTACSVGPNVVRTAGDLLVEYAIDQGGARADISGRFWTGTAWGPVVDLDGGTGCDGGPCAVGTINQSVIPAGESDGLGEKQARTFGEAQIDLDLIFDDTKCTSFGSAMLKSRSSDAFTSQLKDFIRPVPINLTNCGKVIIHKETDPDGATASFGFTKEFDTDPANGDTFSLTDGGTKTFNGVLFGTGYTVDETTIPTGWDFDSVDCSASVGVTPTSIVGSLVTFDIDDEDDVLECTYNNKARAKLTVVKEANDGTLPADFDFTSTTLTPGSFTLTPTATGAAGADSQEFDDLAPATYDVAEDEPAGWNLVSALCDNGDDPSAVTLEAGDDVTCTFVNEVERGAIEITKTRKHAADGPGDHPHAGVTFTITGGELDASGAEVVTLADGTVCLDDLLYGDYTVAETVPPNYVSADDEQDVTVSLESTCGDGNEATVSFSNAPLTDVTVSVDSLVDGGTASTISCEDSEGNLYNGSTGANGDGSLTVEDLLPTDPTVTLTCEITVDP
jgi:hypothetical protein